jgi:cytochrome c-type biogenesis protein CcmH/NrfG
MSAKGFRRVSLGAASALFCLAFAMGLTQSWLSRRALPDLGMDVLAQAKANFSAGDTLDAVAQLRMYTHLEPGRAENWIQLGEALAQLGYRAEASDAFERSLELPITSGSTTHAATLQRLALIYYELGRLEEARDRARLALSFGAELPPAFVNRLSLDVEQPL